MLNRIAGSILNRLCCPQSIEAKKGYRGTNIGKKNQGAMPALDEITAFVEND